MNRVRHGLVLIAASLGVLALVLGASAALAQPTTGGDPPGKVLVGVQEAGLEGKIELYNDAGERVWVRQNAGSYHGVSRDGEGRILAALVHGSMDRCGPYSPPCARSGFRVIDRHSGQTLRSWTFPVRSFGNSELHDVERLPSGEVVLADMDRERIFTVNQSGAITWQWNASRFYDAPADPTTRDWLHINDVDHLGDGRLLVSVRNANQLLVIKRGAGVQQVINKDRGQADEEACRRDGRLVRDADGVRCGDPALFKQQHNPQWLGPDAVLVADSENGRIVELHQQPDGNWTIAWSIRSAGGEAFHWPRDADRLPNGNTIITDSRNNRVVSVDERGTIQWELRTASLPYEADLFGVGERVGGQTYDGGQVGQATSRLPVATELLTAAQHIVSLPHWFSSWTMLGALLALSGVLAGVFEVGAGLWRRRQRSDDPLSRDAMGERSAASGSGDTDD